MFDGSGHRIVIAEDDLSVLALLRTRLEIAGFPTSFACNGRQALDVIASVQPSVVVLDLNMPSLDGFGVLEAMNADPRLRKIPVLVLTACNAGTDLSDCLQLGAMDYMTKPFDDQLFLRRVIRLAMMQSRSSSRRTARA